LYSQWKKYFDEKCSLLDILVKMLLNADRGIKHVFNLIFQLFGCEDPKFKTLKTGTQTLFGKLYFYYSNIVGQILVKYFFLEIFLAEIELTLNTSLLSPPIVKELLANLYTFKPYLLSTNVDVAQPAARLFNRVGLYFSYEWIYTKHKNNN
jgi:hypothetical protein